LLNDADVHVDVAVFLDANGNANAPVYDPVNVHVTVYLDLYLS
jgi:hypothetical protein